MNFDRLSASIYYEFDERFDEEFQDINEDGIDDASNFSPTEHGFI